jgi:hypothetical protein
VAVEKMMLAPTHPPVFAKRAQNVLKTNDRACKKACKSSELADNNGHKPVIVDELTRRERTGMKCPGDLETEPNTTSAARLGIQEGSGEAL